MAYDGGYYLIREPLVRAGINLHTGALEKPISDTTMAAVNDIQATPWRINGWLLDVMEEAWGNGDHLGGIPAAEDKPLPPEMPEAVWKTLSDEARKDHKKKRAEVWSHNASMEGARGAFLDKLSVARELRDHPAIYFPHFCDFRGRIYPMTGAGPSPQSDDIGRALLMFAEGLPLGPDGLFWLCIRAANTFGQDKLTLEERVVWAEQHMDQIIECAREPLNGSRWWTEADEPWSFLATCRELALAFELADPSAFVSHLPIPQDGTCNGLQHLSAMGRDPIGAKATNLTSDPVRQDVYEEVAVVVRKLVQEDMLAGKDEAHRWYGKVARKTVKRAVMTTPYGVTDRGIRDQLLNDKLVEGEKATRGQDANYLKDKIVHALGETVASAKDIMAWLQGVAGELARLEKPFDFTTPTGNRIRMSYFHLARKEVATLMGKVVLWEEEPRGGLNARKQQLAAAPNVIHAFDASHMVLTVNAGSAQGITSWAMIHDSYGTHAANTTRMNAILREQFVQMYAETDWLERIEQEVKGYAPEAELPPRPASGTFDVTEVREARFFFS